MRTQHGSDENQTAIIDAKREGILEIKPEACTTTQCHNARNWWN